MRTFIESCRCKGARPSGIVGLRHNLRPGLTAKMLSERSCARYIIAPNGYGKSSLAYEYSQIVFEFQHVFWIRCDSPCFIRDLDKGDLSKLVLEADSDAKLVVCDDVPHLDSERSRLFQEFIDGLIESRCEVVVCCVPINDTFSSLGTYGLKINSSDLLLCDEEVEVERLRGINVSSFDDHGMQWRIPSFVWNDGETEDIVSGMRFEYMPLSFKCAMFAMLLLQEGKLEGLDELLKSKLPAEDAAYLAEYYPYLGIDVIDGSFQTIELEVADLIKGIGSDIKTIPMGFRKLDDGDMGTMLANELIGKGALGRAAELIMLIEKGDKRVKWAEQNGWNLAFAPDPLSCLRIFEDSHSKRVKLSSDIWTMAAWCAYILGDEEASRDYCMKAYRTNSAKWEFKGACDLLCMVTESAKPESRAKAGTASMLDFHECEAHSDSIIDWNLAYSLEEELLDGIDEFIEAWKACLDDPLDTIDSNIRDRTLVLSSAFFLKSILEKGESFSPSDEMMGTIDFLTRRIIRIIEKTDESDAMMWPEYIAIKFMGECMDRFPFDFSAALAPSDIAFVRSVDMMLFEQANKWRAARDETKRKRGEFELTHPDPFRRNSLKASEYLALRASTPTLSIALFGGLDCWIGDQEIGGRILTRDKAKSLLAIMALNHGREVSREKLVDAIWPESNFDAANKNLYVVWSYLKRSLSVGDSCPYLLRTQNGFRLDMRYVSCDLTDFEDLCRGLLFGRDSMAQWEEMFEKVSGRFSDDLLPSITNNESIDEARKMYRDQLVDGLVSASNRLYSQNEVRGATWYAREAKRRDPSREDVYIALMEAQIASDQRASALDTYFECRRYLSEKMGIDPSVKVMELYRSIIEEEHEF